MELDFDKIDCSKYQLPSSLYIDLYSCVKRKFEEYEPDKKYGSSEHDFWKNNFDLIINSIQNKTGIPSLFKSYNYLNEKLTIAQKGQLISIKQHQLETLCRYCGYHNSGDFLRGDDVSDESKRAFENILIHSNYWNVPLNERVVKILDKYVNTNWWFYFLGSDRHDINNEYSLIKLKFRINEKIDNNYLVEIENTPNKEHPDYIGHIETAASTQNVIVCNLITKDTGSRFLHLKFSINSSLPPELCIGVYSNYEGGADINSGSFIIVNAKDDKNYKDTLPSAHKYADTNIEKEDSIPKVIFDFFRHKDNNFIRCPTSIYSFRNLEKWKEKKDNEKNLD